jgi:phage repressor protein C with HTH and peptisase S24 domain
MKKNEGKILVEWMAETGLSAPGLARNLGVTKANVYYHMKQEVIADEFKNRLSQAGYAINGLKVKPFDKEVDTPGMVSEPPVYLGRANVQPVNLSEKAVMYVPLVNKYAYAGYLSGFGDVEYIQSLPTVPMISDREGRGTYMAFEVKGDSMDDGSRDSYEQGDIIICREIAPHHWRNKLHIHKYDFVIVHRTEGVLLKKISKHDTASGILTLHSLNPLYDDFTIDLDDVAQIFNVIRVEREK